MRTFLRISLCLACAVWSFGQTPETIRYENLPATVLYSNGYLVGWDSPDYTEATIFGRGRKPMYSKPEREGSLVYKNAWAVDSDGVTAGVYTQRQPWTGRLDVLDANGNVKASLNTGSYLPPASGDAPRKPGTPPDPNVKRMRNGISGDARRSTTELGNQFIDIKVKLAVEQIQGLLASGGAARHKR